MDKDKQARHGLRPLSYVLITPARNEAEFIEQTIQSIISQTVRPRKWIIVSDGSTDQTDDIVKNYAALNPWIELIRVPERKERHFAGKVQAFNAGWERVAGVEYEIIGNLDADVSFGPDYIEYLLGKFAQKQQLGVAGTNRCEGSPVYDYRFTSVEDVSGACQLFRRECFESIGGYRPVKGGGIDTLAVITARMQGWETRTFTGRFLIHHRPQGTAGAGPWMAHFKDGRRDYMLGGHPLWELVRSAYRVTKRPFVIGGCLLFGGYFWSMVRRIERPVPADLIRFRRKEQLSRLERFFRGFFTPRAARQNVARANGDSE
jgi:biofilm PGA synthesis N-glycosyltransferase PgaC